MFDFLILDIVVLDIMIAVFLTVHFTAADSQIFYFIIPIFCVSLFFIFNLYFDCDVMRFCSFINVSWLFFQCRCTLAVMRHQYVQYIYWITDITNGFRGVYSPTLELLAVSYCSGVGYGGCCDDEVEMVVVVMLMIPVAMVLLMILTTMGVRGCG